MFVVCSFNYVVSIVCQSAIGVQITFVFNLKYFNSHICNLTSFLVFRVIYAKLADFGDGDIKYHLFIFLHFFSSSCKHVLESSLWETTCIRSEACVDACIDFSRAALQITRLLTALGLGPISVSPICNDRSFILKRPISEFSAM